MVMRTIRCCVVLTLNFLFTIRMFYFNGGFLIFQNEERTADWCDSPGNHCFDCRGITDVTIYEQCSDRIMCPVLAEKLMGLTFSVRNCFENSESTCRNIKQILHTTVLDIMVCTTQGTQYSTRPQAEWNITIPRIVINLIPNTVKVHYIGLHTKLCQCFEDALF